MKKIFLCASFILVISGCTVVKYAPPLPPDDANQNTEEGPVAIVPEDHEDMNSADALEVPAGLSQESVDISGPITVSDTTLAEFVEIEPDLLDESENFSPTSEYTAPDVNPIFEQHQEGIMENAEENVSEVSPPPQEERGEDLKGEIEVFEDYQCGFCKQFERETLIPLREKYPNVTIILRHFPLSSIHPNAYEAAKFAVCAERQGKFLMMSDALFATSDLSTENLFALAENIGLDKSVLTPCLEDSETVNTIESDRTYGHSLGVSRTPTFFLNGTKFVGAYPIENVEMELRKAQSAEDN